MLRQAARRCAQARRPLSRPLMPLRAWIHSNAGSSRQPISSREVLLGTSAAALGLGIWRYVAGPSDVFLDAEDTPTKPKPKKRARERASSLDTSEKLTTSKESQDSASTSTPELIQTKDREAQESVAIDTTEDSESSTPTDGEEESNTGAFNPVTGEINWDCPCLGGMAHGPCGPEFREAFSCFVYSEEEPKGINCVEKFRAMQDCFRAHPDVYGEEIMRDDDDEESQESSDRNDTSESDSVASKTS